MTRDVEVCAVEDSTKEVMRRMTAHRIRHLPVVEGGRLAGMVSIGDVVKSRLEELQLETGVLRDAWIATH
jgi:CBS domain-containing protein